MEPVAQAREVARHKRLHVRVRHRRAETLVLAHLRTRFARHRDRHLRQRGRKDLARPVLVGGIGVAVQEPDPDALHAELRKVSRHRLDRRLVERLQHPAVDVDPLRHHEPALARHERERLLDHDVVLVVAALVADVEHVAEALGGHQRGECALALDDRVGRERGAVNQQPDHPRVRPRSREHVVHAGEHGVVRGVRSREDLCGGQRIAVLQHDIGERAAHVHADAETDFPVIHDELVPCWLLPAEPRRSPADITSTLVPARLPHVRS